MDRHGRVDRRPLAVLRRRRRTRRESRRAARRARQWTRPQQAMQEPLPAHKRAEILVKVAGGTRPPSRRSGASDLRRGRQADEGRARRSAARDVDVHVRGRRGTQARRRDDSDGRRAGGRREARVHAPATDRRRRRDQPVQLPAQPRRAQARACARRRLRRRAEAGEPDTALRAAARRAGGRGRTCRAAG